MVRLAVGRAGDWGYRDDGSRCQVAALTMLLSVASHSDGRTGQFSFGSEVLPVTLLDLPCVVESYKTYDDSHLVKMCDVGQVRF